MPQSAHLDIQASTWTLVTSGGADAVTLQSLNGEFYIMGTADEVAPTSIDGALLIVPIAIAQNLSLADTFLAITSPRHLWVHSLGGGKISVNHA